MATVQYHFAYISSLEVLQTQKAVLQLVRSAWKSTLPLLLYRYDSSWIPARVIVISRQLLSKTSRSADRSMTASPRLAGRTRLTEADKDATYMQPSCHAGFKTCSLTPSVLLTLPVEDSWIPVLAPGSLEYLGTDTGLLHALTSELNLYWGRGSGTASDGSKRLAEKQLCNKTLGVYLCLDTTIGTPLICR